MINKLYGHSFKETNFYLFLLLFIGMVVYLPGLGSDLIVTQGDITMHVGIIRDSLKHGTFFTPQMYGVPNGFKPPLLFWLGMLSDAIFGISSWAERLPSALFMIGSSLLVFNTLSRFGQSKEISFFTASALLLTFGDYKFSRLVLMEPSLGFFMILGVSIFIRHPFFNVDRGNSSGNSGRTGLIFFAAGLVFGISALIKGPLSIVYSWTLFGVYTIYRFFEIDEQTKKISGTHSILEISSEALVYVFATTLPLALWSLGLFYFIDGGEAVLSFFYGVENLGKFGAENQNPLRIVQGLLLYTMPWTPLLVFGLYRSIRSPLSKGTGRVVRLFLFTTILLLLLHMLPNRKADYYVIPFFPLLFAVAGLAGGESPGKTSLPLKITLIGTGLLWILLELLLVGGRFKSVDYLTVIHLIVGAAFLTGGRLQRKNGIVALYTLVFGVALLYITFQFGVLPKIATPQIPELAKNEITRGLCILNADSTTLTRIGVPLPNRELIAVRRDTLDHCSQKGYPLLIIENPREDNSPCPECILKYEWNVWREGVDPLFSIERSREAKADRYQKYSLFELAGQIKKEKNNNETR